MLSRAPSSGSSVVRWSGTRGAGRPASRRTDLYLRGRFMGNLRTQAGLARAIEWFEQAIAADEGLALAHAGLADALCLTAEYGLMPPEDALPRARAAALRALELDPGSGEAHASFALIHALYEWEWDEAEAFFRRAIELNPGYATAHHWLAIDFLASVGRFEEARQELELARQLDPLSIIIQEGKPYLLMLERRYEEALLAYDVLAELDPGFYKVYTAKGRTLSQMGRYGEAIPMLEKGRAMAGDVPSILGALGQSYALAGQAPSARRLLEELVGDRAREVRARHLFRARARGPRGAGGGARLAGAGRQPPRPAAHRDQDPPRVRQPAAERPLRGAARAPPLPFLA